MDTPATAPVPVPGRPRLLLVERDETVRTALTKFLAAGHEVEAVPDGFTAVAAARRSPPDIVFIDLYLPGTDSLSLIRPLRADPRTAQVPIILLAAPMNRELLLRCLGAGASNFLLKPFTLAELLMCARVELGLRPPFAEVPGSSTLIPGEAAPDTDLNARLPTPGEKSKIRPSHRELI